jgi:hypothetical protein
MDNIKSRKVASSRLKHAFKIANIQAANALPVTHNTVESWINEMFYHFESEIKEEIRTAKSRIYYTFDGWGSKYEKISIIGIIIYIVNCKGENVTRLIGLPELPNYRKCSISKFIFFCCIYTAVNRILYSSINNLQKQYSTIRAFPSDSS